MGLPNLSSCGIVGTEKTREWSSRGKGHPHVMSGGWQEEEGASMTFGWRHYLHRSHMLLFLTLT